MTWIKICGITNLEDALLAVHAGADALGFVFYEKSPRKVDVETARAIVAQLPERVEKVGVFVGSENDFPKIYNAVRLTAVQQHLRFDETRVSDQIAVDLSCFWRPPKMFAVLPARAIVSDQASLYGMMSGFAHWMEDVPDKVLKTMPPGLFDTFFLDSGSTDQPGGTGNTFDWVKALPLVEIMRKKVKIVVAGGLNPGNVSEAITTLHPWGVDVASGTEAKPGKKDPQKVRAFVEAVRRADKTA